MKNIILLFCLCISITVISQTNESVNELNKEFVTVLKKWRNSEAVLDLIKKDPSLIPYIENITADKLLAGSTKINPDFDSLFDEKIHDQTMDLFINFLNGGSIESIEKAYWDVINSPKNKELANALLKHMNRYKDKIIKEVNKLPKKPN